MVCRDIAVSRQDSASWSSIGSESALRVADSNNPSGTVNSPDHIAQQILRLVAAFPTTTAMGYCCEGDVEVEVEVASGSTIVSPMITPLSFLGPMDDGKEKSNLKLKPCCIAACAFFKGATQASTAKFGIAGVLDVLETRFNWGVARCWTICKAAEQSDIDCGGMMNVSVEMLGYALQEQEKEQARITKQDPTEAVSIVKVQIIRKWHPYEAQKKREQYKIAHGAELDFLTQWIDRDVYYHQCAGIVNKHGQLRIWDSGVWILPPTDTSNGQFLADRATVAIRLTPGYGEMPSFLDWGGDLQVPTGYWCTLLQRAVSKDVYNVRPSHATFPLEKQLDILGSVFCSPCKEPSSTRALPPATQDFSVSTQIDSHGILGPPLTIIIGGGTHMSTSPWAGVGVARAIKARFPVAKVVAVDVGHDVTTGMTDPVFDSTAAFDDVLMPYLKGGDTRRQHWHMIIDQMKRQPEAYYIPSTDVEVERVARALLKATPAEKKLVRDRIICPSLEAQAAIEKPGIIAAKDMGLFEIPNYISCKNRSQVEVESFCKQNYPMIVKGPKQGATICYSWPQVQAAMSGGMGEGVYVQELVTGFQRGVAFAAFNGQLTAAVLMEKTAFNSNAKAWSGQFHPCPPILYQALDRFCVEYNWTGGAELEFVEDFSGNWHAIDWNPRFPAWVFAGVYAGVNLPAALIQHAMHAANGDVAFPTSDRLAGETAIGGFSRTVVEIPISANMQQFARSGIIGCATSNYSKAGSTPQESPPLDILPQDTLMSNKCSNDATSAEAVDDEETKTLQINRGFPGFDDKEKDTLSRQVKRLLPDRCLEAVRTPAYFLSRETVRELLASHKKAIEAAIGNLYEVSSDPICRQLEVQMCLSVKTQPHAMVLEEARKANYFGEVITTAEMRACLAAGWKANEIVMNGPGKWYESPKMTNAPELPVSGTRLRCIFADSLADLETIVDRLLDPNDWLDASFVGIRFAPVWVAVSRFGLDSRDPIVFHKAADIIRRLPATGHHQLGLHMHFASSTLGPKQWLGLAQGYLDLCRGFADLCQREPKLLDFGGGWPSQLLDSCSTIDSMTGLLSTARAKFPSLETVQFEPGKSVSERAGSIVTRILEIRELPRKIPKAAVSQHDDHDDLDRADSDDEEDDSQTPRRAIIVDACISDMGSLPTHLHPLLYAKTGSLNKNWSALKGGEDMVWGSICMEFDKLGSNIQIPKDASVGDYIMICFTGAYDMTMSYDFADGQGRDIEILA